MTLFKLGRERVETYYSTCYSKDLNLDDDTVKVKTLRLLRNSRVLKVMKGLKV